MTPTEQCLSLLFGTDEEGRQTGMAALAAMEQEVGRARLAGDFRAAAIAAVQQIEERERAAQ